MPTYADIFAAQISSKAGHPATAQPELIDPFDVALRLKEPDRWMVGYEQAIQRLAQSLAKAHDGPGSRVLIAGGRGAGKSTLLKLTVELSRKEATLQGELHSASDLELPAGEDEDALETLGRRWLAARRAGQLHFLLIDDVNWANLVAGRLHQLHSIFGAFPPTIVYALDFYNLADLKTNAKETYESAEIIRLHPLADRELLALWERYFANVELEDGLVQEIVKRAFGNPRLLLRQGAEFVAEARERQTRRVSHQLARVVWRTGGYDVALKLRETPQMQETRFQVLVRVCQAGQATATSLARAFQWDRALCSYHLGNLEEEGILYSTRTGASVSYGAHDPVRTVVETYLVMGYD